MASGYSGCIRTIRQGFVTFGNENKDPEIKYLKAVCGDNGDQSARLEVYENSNPIAMIFKIVFTEVKNISYIEERQKKIIAMRMQKDNKSFLFYAESQQSTVKWYNCCILLYKIPKYAVPEIPKQNTALQQDEANKSIVKILSEGIGRGLFNKLCAIVMCSRNSTFKIYALDSGEKLLTWHRNGIKLSGYIGSVVFVEVDKTCHGGPGCLWMESITPKSAKLQKQIHDFYTCPQEQMIPSPTDYVFVGSALSSLSIKDNSDQPSQTSYEDEASESDGLVSTTTSIPISTSLSSKTSCSSGYHSGGSYVDESVALKSIQPSFPEITGRVLLNKGKDEKFPPSIAISPIQDTHKIRNGELVLSSNDVSKNISMNTQREMTSLTSSYKTQSKESHNSHKKNTSNTRTLQIDSSVHKSIFAKPKSTHSSALPHLSTGQESTLTMQNCSSLRQRKLEEAAFQNCSVEITKNLDIVEITSHLNACGLLTPNDFQVVINEAITSVKKAHHLLDALPKKDRFFEKFLDCLDKTRNGTGHETIYNALLISYAQEDKQRPQDDA